MRTLTLILLLIMLFCAAANAQQKHAVRTVEPEEVMGTSSNQQKKDSTAPVIKVDIQTMNFILYALDNPDKVLHRDVLLLREWVAQQVKQLQNKEQPKK